MADEPTGTDEEEKVEATPEAAAEEKPKRIRTPRRKRSEEATE